ncbi:MBL fold metallo-hydrolase [Rhodococcus sp. MEB064]|uniref:MBL fold metallo-hydrolase n=1 Tax=Rhodococcus sp. MEB064 TaxID=1587522 RepID=UPI0005ACEE2C|nr:MBL fold metallo-hydrolase [Rhodococcus sp. MEB064]KIQ08121.1 beta-lactamase [Rhodococcus sp. MEB064]
MSSLEVTTVADGVHVAYGPDVNWTLLVDGEDVTLVDSGYPRYVGAVLESLARVGRRPEDVRAILLTHAHIDHIGGAAHFATTYGTPVLTSDTEARHARREYLEQATPLDVARNVWRRGALPWTFRILRAGGTESGAVPDADGFGSVVGPVPGGPLDLPGGPVPVDTAGHTSGHTAYSVPSAGAVLSGDAVITGHALSAHEGPQMLPPLFEHDRPRELAALDAFAALDADVLIPGHGPVHRGSVADAVRRVRAGS